MYLTFVKLSQKEKLILAIVDHGSRLNLKLTELASKHAARIVLEIITVIRIFGLPKSIRTDNDKYFWKIFEQLSWPEGWKAGSLE